MRINKNRSWFVDEDFMMEDMLMAFMERQGMSDLRHKWGTKSYKDEDHTTRHMLSEILNEIERNDINDDT